MRRLHLATDYSPEYEHLLRAATEVNAKPITLTLASSSQATALRAKLYAYFRALREEGLRPDLAHLTKLITVTRSPDGCSLTCSLSSSDFDNEAIRLALALPSAVPQLPLAPAPEVPNDLRERLAALRAAKKSLRNS